MKNEKTIEQLFKLIASKKEPLILALHEHKITKKTSENILVAFAVDRFLTACENAGITVTSDSSSHFVIFIAKDFLFNEKISFPDLTTPILSGLLSDDTGGIIDTFIVRHYTFVYKVIKQLKHVINIKK